MLTSLPSPIDVVVLGGGPAGTAAAILLSKAGRSVVLIERERQAKHKVCGEFLSAEALGLLQALAIDTEDHGSLSVQAVRLASARRVVDAKLPFPARSLTRRCLDEVLLHRAIESGVHVVRGRTVEALLREQTWRVVLDEGDCIEVEQVVLATGKHDLRGFRRPPGRQGDLVALKMYFELSAAQQRELAGVVELLLHPGGYTGLQLVEGGNANLCALVQRSRLAQLGGWEGFLEELCRQNPHAAGRLHGATAQLPKPLATSGIPYGFVRGEAPAPNLFAVGDQAAVIPSFTGDGLSLALYTGFAAAQAILRGDSAQDYQHRVFLALRGQVQRATVLSRALVQPAAQPMLAAAASVWPGSLGRLASVTRLDERTFATSLEFAESL